MTPASGPAPSAVAPGGAPIALDPAGALGIPVREIDWQRIVAIAMAPGGLVMSRLCDGCDRRLVPRVALLASF